MSTTPLDPGAVTRMANVQKQAARQTMPFNQAAQASLRHQVKGTSAPRTGPPVVTQPQNATLAPQAPGSVTVPTGGPQAPQEMAAGFDPAIFAEQALDQIVGEVRTQQFMESPRVKDAMESIRLKNLMNADNPRYVKDTRPLFQQLVSKMGMDR